MAPVLAACEKAELRRAQARARLTRLGSPDTEFSPGNRSLLSNANATQVLSLKKSQQHSP